MIEGIKVERKLKACDVIKTFGKDFHTYLFS